MFSQVKAIILLPKQPKPLQEIFKLHKRKMSSAATATEPEVPDDVLFESTDVFGVALLNRPKALNALNLSMVTKLTRKLEEWEKTKQFVIVKGAGEKAFCAGGDVRYATALEPSQNSRGKTFFRNEYIMNNLIGTYSIPYIALIDGITMGGGVGISVHGHYRIATEKTLFAMPETAIGLFPDVGGSYFLPRLIGKLGLYLGLSGHQLKGSDVMKAGIATHYIESSKLPKLYEELTNSTTADNLDSVITKHTDLMHSHPFSLLPLRSKIDHCFSGNTIEEIVQRLKEDKSDWANNTLENLKKMSPLSLKITKRANDFGSKQSLQDCLKMENRLAAAAIEARVSKDFYEGVRALLVDKDKNPKWNPKTLEEISDDTVNKCFGPLEHIEEEISYLRSRKK